MSESEHNEATESAWPALEKIREGYKKGEILIMTGGHHKGRSRLAELALLRSIEEAQRPGLMAYEGNLPEPIVIEAQEEHRDFFGFPNDKRRKPKKRKLKRKFRP